MLLIRAMRLACAFTFFVALTGCTEVFDPCPETKEVEFRGQLDGTWNLALINGQTIPPEGYSPHTLITKRIISGKLIFETVEAEGSKDCNELDKSSGNVFAVYTIRKGAETKTDWQIGGFDYDHKNKRVTLHYAGKSANATLSTGPAPLVYMDLHITVAQLGFGAEAALAGISDLGITASFARTGVAGPGGDGGGQVPLPAVK